MSTPQDVALSDVRKGIAMLRKVSVPVRFSFLSFFDAFTSLTNPFFLNQITGLILNQSYYLCPTCVSPEPQYLFGTSTINEIPIHIHSL